MLRLLPLNPHSQFLLFSFLNFHFKRFQVIIVIYFFFFYQSAGPPLNITSMIWALSKFGQVLFLNYLKRLPSKLYIAKQLFFFCLSLTEKSREARGIDTHASLAACKAGKNDCPNYPNVLIFYFLFKGDHVNQNKKKNFSLFKKLHY